MNKIFHFLTVIVLCIFSLSSCKVFPPTYQRVENFKFERLDKEGFKLSADAVFHNPNNLKFRIDDIQMDVLMDGKQIGSLGEKSEVAINKKTDFTVPLAIAVNPDMSFVEAIKKVTDLIRKREAEITLSGRVVVKAFIFKFPIPINETQKINLSKIK